ncbi:MbcA/ParS/Xre antitoxin family protein [Hydrogenophaga sp.]|nr:MbcA/ParS/Xre antitoxin family protein [Hydrogenophaga sp.]MDO9506372.1 MbcA/ParS/Xre antitoxin family protein [Hydrogenophaga sp.]
MATDTFETEQDAAEWLSRPHPMLDHETPLQTAQTEAGAHRVKALLVAIKYGGVI